jgi:rhodanese-related sulfurtransferase
MHTLSRDSIELLTEHGVVAHQHPLRQAREYAFELNKLLECDPALQHDEGPFMGRSRVPYGWGCVLSNVRRAHIEDSDFDEFFPEYKTLLRDDLEDALDPYEFEKRLWGMFTLTFPYALSLLQRDRVRWHLFPELRIHATQMRPRFDADGGSLDLPDLLQVMDLQQEQVARSLAAGHRVIHGVAGSGKTHILIFRARQLAAANPEQPILVLCFNGALSQRIDAMLRLRGVSALVVVRTFHAWCEEMVCTYKLTPPQAPAHTSDYFQQLAGTTHAALRIGLIPGGQYSALLIDEAHDFQDSWLEMASKLVNPNSNSLLILYDDAQSIYQKTRQKFDFANVGISAVGRTSVFKLNYRNTAEVLALAAHCAQNLQTELVETEEQIQNVQPASAGRHGPMPIFLEAVNGLQEADWIAKRVATACAEGTAPSDIAVLCRLKKQMDTIEHAIAGWGVRCQSMGHPDFHSFDWSVPSVKLITLHSATGLEFPLVFVAGLDCMPLMNEPMDDALRLLYVGMTRTTHTLVLSAAGPSAMVQQVKSSLDAVGQQFAACEV